MKDSKYYKKKNCKQNISGKGWLTKLLLSIIIVLISLIITNIDDDIRYYYNDKLFNDNFDFSIIRKYYDKFIGSVNDNVESISVANSSLIFDEDLREENDDGSYLINVGEDYAVFALESGIIVYIGEKNDLGNTIIIQGNDGVDLWYSNIIVDSYSLYDYVKKGDIIGVTEEKKLILTIMKDGNNLKYDEYFT